jgi:hypothetical protein
MAAIEGKTGMAGGYDDGEAGVGNTTTPYREATRVGKFPNDNTGPNRSQGEVPGAGSLYAAMLNERPNVAMGAIVNGGPSREPSRSGSTPIPVVGMESRKVNRL